MNLLPICVDVVQSYGREADQISHMLRVRVGVGRRAVRLMGARSLSYESLNSVPKRTFWA
jgi:hypothetical protein